MEIADRWDEANDKAPRVRISYGDSLKPSDPKVKCQLCSVLDQQQATWKIGLTFLTGDQLEYRRQEFRAEFFVCDFHVRHPWTVKRPDEGEA